MTGPHLLAERPTARQSIPMTEADRSALVAMASQAGVGTGLMARAMIRHQITQGLTADLQGVVDREARAESARASDAARTNVNRRWAAVAQRRHQETEVQE